MLRNLVSFAVDVGVDVADHFASTARGFSHLRASLLNFLAYLHGSCNS